MTLLEQIEDLKRMVREAEQMGIICDAMRDEIWDLEREIKQYESTK